MEKYKAKENNLDPMANEVLEKSEEEKKQEATEKAVDVAAETALDIYTGGQFSKIKGTMEKVPIVGQKFNDQWNKAVKGVSKVVSKTPAGDMLKKADDMGLTDAAKTAKDSMEMTKGNKTGDATNKALGGKSQESSALKNNNTLKTSNMFDFKGFNFSKNIKVKIILILGCSFLFIIIMVGTVLASDDLHNLSLTNNSDITVKEGAFSGITDASMYDGQGLVMPASGQTLLSLLGQEKLDEINAQIKSDVIKAGEGTGGGVATAAYDFIKLLSDNGINMTYTYGGEHGIVKEGIIGSWGYGNGLDCSAFVSWALYNGGCRNHTTAVVSGVQATYGVETTSDKLKAGDVIANEKHVMLVLSNTGTSVIVAHASSTNIGIVFSERSYDSLSAFSLRDMTSYYQENCSS